MKWELTFQIENMTFDINTVSTISKKVIYFRDHIQQLLNNEFLPVLAQQK